MAKVIRRNLPINETYKLVSSYYTGGVEFGTECCANCNKIITNVVVIENSKSEKFSVGADCAATLSGIAGTIEFMGMEADFAEAKGIRAKINKALKNEGTKLVLRNTSNGCVTAFVDGYCSVQMQKFFLNTFLPDFVSKIENPEKNDFVPVFCESVKNQLFLELNPKQPFDPIRLTTEGYQVIVINDTTSAPNFNPIFGIEIYKDGSLIVKKQEYMGRNIKSRIIWAINEHLFNL